MGKSDCVFITIVATTAHFTSNKVLKAFVIFYIRKILQNVYIECLVRQFYIGVKLTKFNKRILQTASHNSLLISLQLILITLILSTFLIVKAAKY